MRLVESSIVPHEPASYAAHACCCCGAHAYMCRAAALAEMISAELEDDVTFELEPTPDVTGHFEVEVVGGDQTKVRCCGGFGASFRSWAQQAAKNPWDAEGLSQNWIPVL
eukprot:COSAG01_NODE_4326_length_5131_cov_18.323132_5_plen_110_part_00